MQRDQSPQFVILILLVLLIPVKSTRLSRVTIPQMLSKLVHYLLIACHALLCLLLSYTLPYSNAWACFCIDEALVESFSDPIPLFFRLSYLIIAKEHVFQYTHGKANGCSECPSRQ